MAALTIRIKKQTDGSAALTCIRADGTATWQKQLGAQGRFFPYHDLTHYAVETTLNHRKGFYGMVASGWNMTDFGAPERKGMLADMDPSELIVGFLDAERASRAQWSAEECNEKMAVFYEQHGMPNPPTVTDEQLEAVRRRCRELWDRWEAVKPGEALELPFPEGAAR